jgi:putative ATP-dependent endonuclease of OLD family
MHLRQLDLGNFRSFSQENVSFERGLTVLVGENNGGKSNIIDAIRLLTTPLSGRRELYCEQTDIRFGATPRAFELRATFDGLSPPQQGRLLSATTNDTLQEACFGLTYDATGRKSHVRPALWAGRFKAIPESGSHEMIRHVYLPPLRDAKRELASGNPTRIHALLNHFLGERDPEEVAKSLARTSAHPILTDVDTTVATGLDILTAGVRRQGAALGFNSDEKLIDIARDLRFKLADHGIMPEDLQYSGHGFANLLYIATIAVELERTDNAELTMFLVEEPEAHLHPQLQAAVLNFLEERAEQSLKTKDDRNAPAGHLQVIVATHSPNLSAWVPSKSLVFVRSVVPVAMNDESTEQPASGEAAETTDPQMEEMPSARPESRCIPLAKLDLSDPDRRKIDRYLDVTKSALLFGGRVLLVEGIAEALLFPVIAKHYVLKDRPAEFRIFRSAVFVPIDGVDFTPYAKALLSPYDGVRIADRLVIVTDGDKHTADEGEAAPGDRRKANLDALAAEKGAVDVLDVYVNTYSLETELVAAGNEACMKDVYLALHPRSEAKWDEAIAKDGDARAKAIQEMFKITPKGDFAQILAEKVAASDSLNVPSYIRDAIEALVK